MNVSHKELRMRAATAVKRISDACGGDDVDWLKEYILGILKDNWTNLGGIVQNVENMATEAEECIKIDVTGRPTLRSMISK